jgi:hypothetical protein
LSHLALRFPQMPANFCELDSHHFRLFPFISYGTTMRSTTGPHSPCQDYTSLTLEDCPKTSPKNVLTMGRLLYYYGVVHFRLSQEFWHVVCGRNDRNLILRRSSLRSGEMVL